MADNDKVRELHDRLLAQVEALVEGDDWRRFLAVAARFHRYRTGRGGIFERSQYAIPQGWSQHPETTREGRSVDRADVVCPELSVEPFCQRYAESVRGGGVVAVGPGGSTSGATEAPCRCQAPGRLIAAAVWCWLISLATWLRRADVAQGGQASRR